VEERFAELAREVARTEPDPIVASSAPLILSFKSVTDTIPVVGVMADPVAYGIVASVARPGGNITGVGVDAGLEIWGKRLQILREAVPTASKVPLLATRGQYALEVAMREAARKTGICDIVSY